MLYTIKQLASQTISVVLLCVDKGTKIMPNAKSKSKNSKAKVARKSGSNASAAAKAVSWRQWQTRQKVFTAVLAAIVVVSVGWIGIHKNNQSSAQSVEQYRTIHVWASYVNVRRCASTYCGEVSNLGTSHSPTALWQCKSSDPHGRVTSGGSYNNWWVWLPYRHGYISAVFVSYALPYTGYYAGYNGNNQPIKGLYETYC